MDCSIDGTTSPGFVPAFGGGIETTLSPAGAAERVGALRARRDGQCVAEGGVALPLHPPLGGEGRGGNVLFSIHSRVQSRCVEVLRVDGSIDGTTSPGFVPAFGGGIETTLSPAGRRRGWARSARCKFGSLSRASSVALGSGPAKGDAAMRTLHFSPAFNHTPPTRELAIDGWLGRIVLVKPRRHPEAQAEICFHLFLP